MEDGPKLVEANVPALELEVKVVEASVAGERAVSLHGNDGDGGVKMGELELNGLPSL